MNCLFFLFLNTCRLLFEFILTIIWVTFNACWPNNYVDMALNYFDKTSISNDLVLFTLQISFVFC
jgi:hypothetical protein